MPRASPEAWSKYRCTLRSLSGPGARVPRAGWGVSSKSPEPFSASRRERHVRRVRSPDQLAPANFRRSGRSKLWSIPLKGNESVAANRFFGSRFDFKRRDAASTLPPPWSKAHAAKRGKRAGAGSTTFARRSGLCFFAIFALPTLLSSARRCAACLQVFIRHGAI
jgi:hypothetical protein